MNDLRQMLQDKRDWLVNTTCARHVNVKLTGEQLEMLVDLLAPVEMVGSNLPKIEPRMLAQGCSRSHPHENMSHECEQKTLEARAAKERRTLGQQEPRGTRRSQEEIRAILQATYGGGNPYNSGGFKVLA